MTTPGQHNTPRENAVRDGHGRFRRSVASVDRDARAAELAARGWTYAQIAAELGYSDRAAAWRGAQAALVATVDRESLREAKVKQLSELAQLRARMWRTVDSPPPLTDRLGRVVTDPETGDPVPDEAARQGAAQVILRASEREARLRGTEAPKRSMSVSATLASLSPEDIWAYIRELKAQVEAEEQAPDTRLSAWDRSAIPGAVERP